MLAIFPVDLTSFSYETHKKKKKKKCNGLYISDSMATARLLT